MLFEEIQNKGENKKHVTCFMLLVYIPYFHGSQMEFVFSITVTECDCKGEMKEKRSPV